MYYEKLRQKYVLLLEYSTICGAGLAISYGLNKIPRARPCTIQCLLTAGRNAVPCRSILR